MIPFFRKNDQILPPPPAPMVDVSGAKPHTQTRWLIALPILIIPISALLALWLSSNDRPLQTRSNANNGTSQLVTDGSISELSSIQLAKGETLTVDIQDDKALSEVTLYTDVSQPGNVSGPVRVDIVSPTGAVKTVYEGNLLGGSQGTTISFPSTVGDSIQITNNGETPITVSEIIPQIPSLTATPVITTASSQTPLSTPVLTVVPTVVVLSPTSWVQAVLPSPTSASVSIPTPTPVSFNATVTSNGTTQVFLEKLVNSIIHIDDYAQVEAGAYMQVHLSSPVTITKIQVYPRPIANKIVKALKVEVGSSPSLANAQTLYYSDTLATVNGIVIIPNPPVVAQYIRVTAEGTDEDGVIDPVNRMTEVAIWAQ